MCLNGGCNDMYLILLCYSYYSNKSMLLAFDSIRFASPLALLMSGDPSEGAVQLSSHFRILVVCSGFEIVQLGVNKVR